MAGQMMLQDDVNRTVYYSAGVYRHYLSELLTPPEIACLLKYHSEVADRDVLDVGVGAGRTTRYLAPLARRYEAVDYSPVMVAYMKRTMPEVSVRQANFRDLGIFDHGSFDFVFAPDNVIDALQHDDRLRALAEAHRVLRPGGTFVFSSHNLRYKNAFSGPRLNWSRNPVRFAANCVHFILSCWNYLRIAHARTNMHEYAILNDPGHHYGCLHYYVARGTINSQLAGVGLRLVEAFDTRGHVIPEGQDDSQDPSLLYVAKRSDN